MSDQRSLHLFDLKTPLGGLLAFYGVVLTIYGLVSDASLYERSLGMNVNLWWGLVMAVGGGGLLWWSMRGGEGRKGAE